MAKNSIMTDAKDTMVEAAKSGAEGMKTVAGEALGAAAVAAAGVVLDHVSKALSQGSQQVETSKPAAERAVSDAAVSFVSGPPARKKARKKAAKKQAAKAMPAKKGAKKKSAKKAAKKTVKKAAAKKKSAKKTKAAPKKAAKKSSKTAAKKKSGAKRKTKK